MKLFLDTNVMIDDIGKRDVFGEHAALLHLAHLFGDVELLVSAKSYTDVFYVLNKFTDALSLKGSLKSSLELYKICSVDEEDILAALDLAMDDFEDALMATTARKVGADYIITRDATFDGCGIPVKSPEEFLDLMREKGITYTMMDG